MIDIVLPKDNEEEFIKVASRLDLKKLYFLYDFDEYSNKKNQKSKSFDFDIEIGFIVNQKNINQASKNSRFLAIKSTGNDRSFIESKKIKLIYGFEHIYKKDYLHQRASGLNHTLCELCKKNNVAVGISYSSLFNKNSQTVALLIGRMMQNIALCQKYGVKIVICSFSANPFSLRSPYDISSLFSMLGIDKGKMNEFFVFNKIC